MARPILSVGARPLRDDLAVTREPGDAPAFGDFGKLGRARRRQRARSAHVDIEAVGGRRHLDVERLARSAERFGDAQAVSIAPSSAGARIGQRSIATT